MKPAQIRKKFLEDNAEFLLDEYNKVLRGTGEFSCKYGAVRSDMWNTLVDIIKSAKDIHMIDAKNASDILSLLSEGHITADHAKDFMSLLQTKQDIEELPKLVKALEELKK